ncbi:MAG: lactate dehydrogenase [Dethiosulfovibrio peptidovorans]|nr:MAG: lactate dehydrogenase [Dethiosulfovibrio peptidovorans]
MLVSYEKLTSHVEEILSRGLGYTKDQAAMTAWVLVEADARGVPSHGVARLAFYRKNLKRGFAFTDREPHVVHETPVSLVVDGCSGIGPSVAAFAVDRCTEKALEVGTCSCTVRDSNHYGMAGLWAERAAEKGCIAVAMTNTRRCCMVTFGSQRLLGTNPIAVAIPGEGEDLFLLDMATPVVAHGKVEVYCRRNQPMPLGWVVDEHGQETSDARASEKLFRDSPDRGGHLFLGGEGETLGGHKGYGLGLMVELLCSGLSLGRWSPETFEEPGTGSGITHYFAVTKLDVFGNSDAIRQRVTSILNGIRTSDRVDGQDRIYIHGEKEREARRKSLLQGIKLDDVTTELLQSYAQEFDISPLN